MSQGTILLISVVVGLLVAVIAIAVGIMITRRSQRRERMMSAIGVKAKVSKADDEAVKEKRRASQRADLARKLSDEKKKDKDKGESLDKRLQMAGFEISGKRFRVFAALFGVILIGLFFSMDFHPAAALMLGFALSIILPRMFLRWKINRRQKKFLEEFADALDGMTRLLQAGMPVSEAIAMVSREFGGPIGEEMMKIYDDQKVGLTMPEATARAAARMPLTEMKMFATAIAIQSETGSSLSEVLTNLSGVLRARFQLKRKVRALSAEAKAGAMIIGSLPILVGAAVNFLNPEYMGPMFVEFHGKVMLSGAGFWMLCGVLVMRQMINFKV